MKEIILECPSCNNIQIETVLGKGTALCRRCNWPVDIYEDGTSISSPLADCIGEVYADPYDSVCKGMGYRGKYVRTKNI